MWHREESVTVTEIQSYTASVCHCRQYMEDVKPDVCSILLIQWVLPVPWDQA